MRIHNHIKIRSLLIRKLTYVVPRTKFLNRSYENLAFYKFLTTNIR